MLGFLGVAATTHAADLKESKFTQVVNDVQVISPADNSKRAAALQALFKLPEVLRTGAQSRAELTADDHTITRVGANTIFSFDAPTRTMNLERGSLLFHSPKGKGGGNIHTPAATAAVLGTTIIVTTTSDGGFKVLTLEGRAEVRFANNVRRRLKAGQMVFVLPKSLPGPVLVFRLDQQVAGSLLVGGFDTPLPSLSLINQAITDQNHQIEAGRAQDTGLLAGNSATSTSVQTIKLFDTISASPGAGSGNVIGLSGSGTPGAGGGSNNFTLPPGFVVPPGTTFNPVNGSFVTADGLAFFAFNTNGTAAPVQNAAGPAAASLTDAVVGNGTTARNAHLFLNPVAVVDISGTHPGVNGSAVLSEFVARNITFVGSQVDLSPVTSQQQFGIGAAQSITFANTVSFINSPADLEFAAGTGFVFQPGSSVTSDSPLLFFTSPQNSLTLNNANITDTSTTLALEAGTSLTLNNSFLTAPNVALDSGTSMTVSADSSDSGSINASQITLSSGSGMTIGENLNATQGGIFLNNTGGTLTANNGANFTTGALIVNSPGGISFNNTSISANDVEMTAANTSGTLATIQNTTFSQAGTVSISAHTVVLNTVDFANGSTVNLNCNSGSLAPNPNTAAAVVPGDVNYIRGVTYGGQPAENFTGGVGSKLPIIIGKAP